MRLLLVVPLLILACAAPQPVRPKPPASFEAPNTSALSNKIRKEKDPDYEARVASEKAAEKVYEDALLRRAKQAQAEGTLVEAASIYATLHQTPPEDVGWAGLNYLLKQIDMSNATEAYRAVKAAGDKGGPGTYRIIDLLQVPGIIKGLNGAVRRMATLCTGGRIGTRDVADEIERLAAAWAQPASEVTCEARVLVDKYLGDAAEHIDRFDLAQLEEVLAVCETSPSMAHAGKRLFSVSRANKKSANDSDRIRKYLARFGLSFSELVQAPRQ